MRVHSAESRYNEMQLEKIAFEGQEMHERSQRILIALHEQLVQQRPALAADMEYELSRMGEDLQVTTPETSTSLPVPSVGRRRSEDSAFKDGDWYRQSKSQRSRSLSVSGSTMFEADIIEPRNHRSQSSEGVLPVRPKPGQRVSADVMAQDSLDTEAMLSKGPTVSLQFSHRETSQCRRPCSCQCHRSFKLKTPDFLRQVTGQLLVGYSGISSITPPCNEHACAQRQKAAIRIQYHFPVWSLIQRMLTVVAYSGGSSGPEKILRMSRIRPGLDEVFIQVQSGNVRRIQQLFVQGDASPLDASDTGWTLLHYALSAGQLPTAKFLKDAGADAQAESHNRQRPVDIAWNRILSGSLNATSENLLRDVFDDDNQLDERQFTTLHKIALGLIGKDLAEELEVTTAHINALDSKGYTPLAWASARGDYKSVVLLLKHGASLSIANNVNAMPIHLAAQTGNIETVKVLVQANADVNCEVHLSHMTPIHFSAEYQDDSQKIFSLVSLGARVDGKDYLGWTPLHWASWRGHLASLNALLDCGADVGAKTLDGKASIMLAVANNSHTCVQRLIQAGADCSVVGDSQWNILHYAAIGGSVATVWALAKADLSNIDLEGLKTKDTGQTVADVVRARRKALAIVEDEPDESVAWTAAWDMLLTAKSECEAIRPLARSGTDSVYHDADDQPFEQRGSTVYPSDCNFVWPPLHAVASAKRRRTEEKGK